MDRIHKFYTSKQWRELAYNLKIKRGGKCDRTGETFVDMSQLIAHHKVELTEDNIDDPNIALNPELIEIISFKEHNKEHRRFGHKKNVYIVYGSPLSGKTTMVRELMQYGDIVLDLDEIWKAISFQEEYIKPNNLRFNVFKMRNDLLEQIKMRYGNWYDAYIIGGYPEKYERQRLAEELGAEIIYCDSTKQECIDRVEESNKPRAWVDYIETWWEKYE